MNNVNIENYKNLIDIFKLLDKQEIKSILDAGSGRTSLYSLIDYFDQAYIEAVIYPGDIRKKQSIIDNVKSSNYQLIEIDLCQSNLTKTYDLVLMHLLLGEATMWHNQFADLLNCVLAINSKYFIIYDYLEDVNVDYQFLEQQLNNNFAIIKKMIVPKDQPQQFKDFLGQNYVIYLIERGNYNGIKRFV